MEKKTLVAMLTDFDETYEIRNVDTVVEEGGEESNERLLISTGDGDKHIPR